VRTITLRQENRPIVDEVPNERRKQMVEVRTWFWRGLLALSDPGYTECGAHKGFVDRVRTSGYSTTRLNPRSSRSLVLQTSPPWS
jgi:hypothetical protein